MSSIDVAPSALKGRYTDPETGLIYLRARYYDTSTGQFITRDPAVAATRTPYGYVFDNPLNSADPLGLGPWGWNPISDATQAWNDTGGKVVHDVGHWATTSVELPNSRFFTGAANAFYGGFKVASGISLLTVGTAEDVTGLGAILGIPTQAYGLYQLGTGAARIYRGYNQLSDAASHPTVCKSPLHYGEDIGLDVLPFGGSLEKVLGGLP